MGWTAYLSSHDVDGNAIPVGYYSYTFNTNAMVRAAAKAAHGDDYAPERPINHLSGLTGAQATRYLEPIVAELQANPEPYLAMAPDNGWGSYTGITDLLASMANDSARCPSGRWGEVG